MCSNESSKTAVGLSTWRDLTAKQWFELLRQLLLPGVTLALLGKEFHRLPCQNVGLCTLWLTEGCLERSELSFMLLHDVNQKGAEGCSTTRLLVALDSALGSPECGTTLKVFLSRVFLIATSRKLGIGNVFIIQQIHLFHNSPCVKLEKAGKIPVSFSWAFSVRILVTDVCRLQRCRQLITSAKKFGDFSVMLSSHKCTQCNVLRKFLTRGMKAVVMLYGDHSSAPGGQVCLSPALQMGTLVVGWDSGEWMQYSMSRGEEWKKKFFKREHLCGHGFPGRPARGGG